MDNTDCEGSLGTITRFLSFYGHGKSIFGDLLISVEQDLLTSRKTPLCEIMKANGSDKGDGWHNYTVLYHHLLEALFDQVDNVFELGVGTNFVDTPSNMGPSGVPGASLRGWTNYFPEAQIYGADIDRRVLFQDERIATLYVDQTDPASVSSLWEHVEPDFDIIIDDGLHEFEANRSFFAGSKHKLKPSGIYIVEDIIAASEILLKYDKYFDACEMSGFLFRLPHTINDHDNAVAVLCGSSIVGLSR